MDAIREVENYFVYINNVMYGTEGICQLQSYRQREGI